MAHSLPQLALFLLAPFFLAQMSENSLISLEKYPLEILGGTCIEVIDPNSGNPSLAFTLDTICQGEVMDFCLSTSGCNEDIEITSVSGSLGQVIITPPSSPFEHCFSYTAPADLVGEDTFTLTITNSESNVVTSETSIELTYVVADPENDTTITPPQELCSPANFTTIEATNPDPIVGGYWVVLQGGGDPITEEDVDNPTLAVTNLPFGESTYMWRQDYPCESTFDLTSITLYDGQAPVAYAGEDIILCSFNDSYTMQGNDPLFSATGTWEIIFGNATINDINDSNAEITGLGIGCHIFEWNISNGPCSGGETVDQIIICVYDENAPDADAGEDIEICASETGINTITTNALDLAPYDPAAGLWTLISGFGVIEDSSDNITLIENLQIGINEFVWTVENGSCPESPTTDTLEVRVYDPNHPLAYAGPDASYCAPVNSHVLSAANATIPALGTWELISGTGSFSNVNDPNAIVTNLSMGVNTYRWVIYNGPCDDVVLSDEVSVVVYDSNIEEAIAGDDISLCQEAFTGVTLGASEFSFPATGEWTIEFPLGINAADLLNDPTDPNAVFSNASPGEYTLRWTVINGPCTEEDNFDETSILIYPTNQVIADAGEDLELCTPIVSFNLSGNVPLAPGTAVWTLISGSGAIQESNNPNTSVTNLGIGHNVFRWTIENGYCGVNPNFSEVTVSVFNVNAEPASAGSDQNFCPLIGDVLIADLSANTPEEPATGEWSIVSGFGSFSDLNDPNARVTNPGVGINIYEWSIDNGACQPITTETLAINVYDPNAEAAFTEPDFRECAPVETLNISANEVNGAALGSWAQIEGTAVIFDESSSTTEISNLDIGTYSFVWEIDNGPCGNSFDTLVIEIFDPSGLNAHAGDDQNFCTPLSTAALEGSAVISPAEGEWEIIIGNGNILIPSSPLATIENLTVGETILSWTVDNGECGGITTDFVSIFVFDASAPEANAGDDQDFCLPITSSTLGALDAIFPAIGNWFVIEGGAEIANINSPNSEVNNLTLGLNLFVWSVDNSPCANGLTMDTMAVRIYPDEFPIANAGGDQSFCSPVNSALTQAAELDAYSIGIWSLTDGSGSILDVNTPTTELEQLGIGTNIFSWQVSHGPCAPELTIDQMTISIYDENYAPAYAGEDQVRCLPDNSVFMEADITIDPVVGEWSIISGGGNIATLDNPASEVTEIPVGENVYVWTTDNGPCENAVTTDTVTVRVYSDAITIADAGADIGVCGESSVLLGAAIPDSPANGTWGLVSGPGSASFDDVTLPNAEISALIVGQYVLQWIVDNGPCENPISFDQMILNVYDVNQAIAYAGDTLRQCMPLNEFQLSASSVVFPSVGTWSNDGSGDISDINDPNAVLSNTEIGVQTLIWSVTNGPCGDSQDDLVIEVFDPNNPPADAGPDQSICTDLTGESQATMNANIPVSPSIGAWIVIFGSLPNISDVNDPNAVISNLGFGETQLQWVIDNAPCAEGSSTDVISIFHFDSNESAAFAGADQSFCDIPLSVSLEANPTIGNNATGAWTVTGSPGGSPPVTFVDFTEESTLVSGFEMGVYEFTWTVDNGECGSTLDVLEVAVFDPSLPSANAGMDVQICEDEFIDIPSVNLEGNQLDLPATVGWSVLEGDAVINEAEISLSTAEVTHLGEITVPFGTAVNTFMYTVNNGPCGGTTDTVTYTLIDCLTIDVPDAFSPNQDFINETWFIPNLYKYPNNEVMVFNRWGTKVFEAKNYQGYWAGVSEHPATIGDHLPVGTYYYVLDLGDDSAAHKGFVYLKR